MLFTHLIIIHNYIIQKLNIKMLCSPIHACAQRSPLLCLDNLLYCTLES